MILKQGVIGFLAVFMISCQSTDMEKVDGSAKSNVQVPQIFETASDKQDFAVQNESTQKPADQEHHHAVVKEILEDGKYFMLLVSEGSSEYWLIARSGEWQLGDHVDFHTGLRKTDYLNTTLGKTFDEVYLVSSITLAHRADEAGTEHGATGGQKSPQSLSAQIEGAMSVAEVLNSPQSLEGKKVKVQGFVTKVNAHIMNRHWVHLSDQETGGNDLVITTQTVVPAGHRVVFEGDVVLNKDFGAGYVFDVLIENAMPL